MKLLFPLYIVVFAAGSIRAQSGNFALHLDGKDNNPCIGMDIIKQQWTLEAWIKGNDKIWKKQEAIIGVGEYGHMNTIDRLPLYLKNGHLASKGAGIVSSEQLDNEWHHVAVTCDGHRTILYLDGKEVGVSDVISDILPGEIGSSDIDSTTFGGSIDEVRIWDRALSRTTIETWMNRPIEQGHPAFSHLKGYYPLDDLQDNVSLNYVGLGGQSYHMRNTRKDFNGNLPLAYLVKNDNPKWHAFRGSQRLFNSVVIQSEWDGSQGTKDDPALKLRIVVQGNEKPLKLSDLNLNFDSTTDLKDIKQVHVYYTGQTPRSKMRTKVLGESFPPKRTHHLKADSKSSFRLNEGINYFLITLDINEKAQCGDTLFGRITSFGLNGQQYRPKEDLADNIRKIVIPKVQSPNILRLLQWNIWNGGIHLGKSEGVDRIRELISRTDADIVTMEEAYGAQKELSDSLQYFMQTASPKANLALYSRYPIERRPSKEAFKSNVAIITMPQGRKLLVADWWLRYAYKQEYTDFYPNKGYDPNRWIAEDSVLGLADTKNNLINDIEPIIKEYPEIPILIAGDFNSGSDLDWTSRASVLHYGYGPVALPIAKFMRSNGFTDSYRELFPNELTHQGGTFAVIYGHLQSSRLDFIYYKGEGIKAKYSKIIRTSPEIDDVWPSDHAAAMTIFSLN